MRLALGGFGGPLPPLILSLTDGVPFRKADFVALGYTNYDVVCIGGGGGRGGGILPPLTTPGTNGQATGGGGGGGGIQRVRGLLSGLPAACPVTVGRGGAYGVNSTTPGSLTGVTDGADGGFSSFNTTLCQASGGKGGTKTAWNGSGSYPFTAGAHGGDGGIGGRTLAGGGPSGGGSAGGVIRPAYGDDGTWDGSIGSGGGGGMGGAGTYNPSSGWTYSFMGASGGRGAYSALDTSFFGEKGSGVGISPGAGGGARATPLNRLLQTFGSYSDAGGSISQNGLVLIVLTKV